MGDARGTIELELWRRVADQVPKFDAALEALTADELASLAQSAAAQIAGPLILRSLLGDDRLDTTKTALFLGITRQAVSKRVHAHTLLGVPGRGTTWFPLWQFDMSRNDVRDVARLVFQTWDQLDTEGKVPWNSVRVLAWATTSQDELDDSTPAEWIESGKSDINVVDAARRAGRALSQ